MYLFRSRKNKKKQEEGRKRKKYIQLKHKQLFGSGGRAETTKEGLLPKEAKGPERGRFGISAMRNSGDTRKNETRNGCLISCFSVNKTGTMAIAKKKIKTSAVFGPPEQKAGWLGALKKRGGRNSMKFKVQDTDQKIQHGKKRTSEFEALFALESCLYTRDEMESRTTKYKGGENKSGDSEP